MSARLPIIHIQAAYERRLSRKKRGEATHEASLVVDHNKVLLATS